MPNPVFSVPNSTQIPDVFFDEVAPTLREGELRVLIYIMRRTFGFGKSGDQISVQQMCSGIVKQDGTQLDQGTGMCPKAIRTAIAGLCERGLLEKAAGKRPTGADAPHYYRMVLRSHGGGSQVTPPPSLQVTPQDTEGGTDDVKAPAPAGAAPPTVRDTPECLAIQAAYDAFPLSGLATDPKGTAKRLYPGLLQLIRVRGLPQLAEWTTWLMSHPQAIPEGADPWAYFCAEFRKAMGPFPEFRKEQALLAGRQDPRRPRGPADASEFTDGKVG